jgi:phage terminase Nu1 subunit (DNA packaging protein)
MPKIVNLSEAAEILGISLPTIRERLKESDFQWVVEEGGKSRPWKIDITAAHHWACDQKAKKAVRKIRWNEETKKARLRLLIAKADLAEFELGRLLGEFIDLNEVERTWSDHVMNARARLLALPIKLGPIVAVEDDPAECAEILKAEVYDALDELARSGDDDALEGL